MKKLMMLVLVVLLTIGVVYTSNARSDIKHEIYIPRDSATFDEVIKTGAFDIVRTDSEHYDEVSCMVKDRYGEAVRMHTGKGMVDKVLSQYNVHIVKRVKEGDKDVIYGYSKKLAGAVNMNGALVNIQINSGNNMVEIGTPLIMGSY